MDSESASAAELDERTEFHYRSLNPKINEIRLVTILPPSPAREAEIECSLSYTPLHEAPVYEALSYTWADEKGDSSLSSTIDIDGSPFLVTKNLEAALRQLRLPSGERVFWIDAICIDQKNDGERSHQVAMMRTIYESASEVAIWLGSKSHSSDFAFALLRRVLDRADAEALVHKVLADPNSKIYPGALSHLFIRPYWDRVWIIQEVLSARKATVYCGSNLIGWAGLIKATDFLVEQCWNFGPSRIAVPYFYSVLSAQGPMSILKNRNANPETLPELFEMLLNFRDKVSTDPRDKVYGIAGLSTARDDPSFTIDYSRTVSEVYKYVAEYVLSSSHSLEIISVGKGNVHPVSLPSWAPDWSGTTKIKSRRIRSRGFDAALGQHVHAIFDSNSSVLRVQGVRIGNIQSVALPVQALSVVEYNLCETDEFSHLLLAIYSWHELAKEGQLETFYDIIGIRAYAEHKPWPIGPIILESFAALINRYLPQHLLDGLLRDSLLRWQDKNENSDISSKLKEASHLASTAALSFGGRRFFLSAIKQMGLAPYIAEAGDLICVLFGSSLPVILRPQDGYYTVVGDAYVYGLMYGEAMEGVSKGEYVIQEFELH